MSDEPKVTGAYDELIARLKSNAVYHSERGATTLAAEEQEAADALASQAARIKELETDGPLVVNKNGATCSMRAWATARIDELQSEFASQAARIAELERDLDQCRKLLRTQVGVATLAELTADAERYRWLRTQPTWLGWDHDFRSDEIDREVDAARAVADKGEAT